MNSRGQALVEFVLILPVFILLVFSFVDVGRIILCKNHLENKLNDVSLMIVNKKTPLEIHNFVKQDDDYKISINITYDNYANVLLKTKLSLITPGMKRIFDEEISVKRKVIYE